MKTVKDLKKYLEENYDDNEIINIVSNTYFLGHCSCFLGIAGYNGGFINLDNPTDSEE